MHRELTACGQARSSSGQTTRVSGGRRQLDSYSVRRVPPPAITRVQFPNGIWQWDVFPTVPFDGFAVAA
jgi:hypothetical protein